jgi:hypothetical protein
LAGLTGLVGEVSGRGGAAAVGRLVDALLAADQTGDAGLAGAALAQLRTMPRVVARLEEHSRRVLWGSDTCAAGVGDAGQRVKAGTGGPIAVALASTDRDGYVRAAAVRAMLEEARREPGWVPFLVLRTGDWVKPVRDRARGGLAVWLADDPRGCLPAVLAMASLTRGRIRGGFAYHQAVAALLHAQPTLRADLLASAAGPLRRLLFDLGLGFEWWAPQTLLDLAATDADRAVRARAAEAASQRAVWTGRVDTLRRLARLPHPQVRANALTGLVRLGHDSEVADHLDDPAALVRAIARDAARRIGLDFHELYRTAVAVADPAPGAIAGLADVGDDADAPRLSALLTHPAPNVRAAALRALRALQTVPIPQTIDLLRDPSPAVVREATTALRPLTRAVPDHVARDLLADHRPDVRRAGYRLLRVRGPAEQLRAALLLATDPDPALARRAVADATRLARAATASGWRRPTPPRLDAPADEITELVALTDRARQLLGHDTTRALRVWLTTEQRP